MLLAFHDGRKASHHARSAWNLALSLIQWSRFLTLVDKSIIRLRMVRPTCTTLQTWGNFPISDNSSRFLHTCLSRQALINDLSITRFCSGSRISLQTVSNVMPRKVRTVDGPSNLSAFRGTPNLLHYSNITSRLFLHFADSGLPTVRKS